MTVKPSASERKEAVYKVLEDAAVAGRRCPMNDQLPHSSYNLGALCKDGRIRIEVYQKNWRVVTILKGPHRGAATAAAPKGEKPYVVIDHTGTYRTGRHVDNRKPKPVTLPFKDGKREAR